MMNKDIATMLNKQINLELFSAYLYKEIANYFTYTGLDGFAHWFNIQVQEETDHANLMIQFLQNNEEKIKLTAIDDPTRNYKSDMEALEEVLSHEQFITKSIHDIYAAALDIKDYRSTQFLDWFVAEQAEEEKNANDLISKYNIFVKNAQSLYSLDQELGTRIHTAPSLNLS